MKKLILAVSVAATFSGCASLDTYTMNPAPAAGWPTLTVREHPGGEVDCWRMMSPARKVLQVVMLVPPSACTWINLCEGTADIYYPSFDHCATLPPDDLGCMAAKAGREHELAHVKGSMHPANLVGNEHYEYWKAGKCAPKAPVDLISKQ